MANNSGTNFALLLVGLLLASSIGSHSHQDAGKMAPSAETIVEEEKPASHELYESERVQFSSTPPGVIQADIQCDANGNIYAAYGGVYSQELIQALSRGESFPISKVSPDSRRVVQFPAGKLEGYANTVRRNFYVDPNGKVYGLMEAGHHEIGYRGPDWPDSVIVKYSDDGTVDSVIKLEPPRGDQDHFEAVKFVALLDGNFLVTGSQWADKYTPTKPLTGIFDRSGTFVAPLTLPNDLGPSAPTPSDSTSESLPQTPPARETAGKGEKRVEFKRTWHVDVLQGLMAGSLDGNVYLLRASSPARLYVINTAGVVLRELEIKSPEPGMLPSEISPAGQNALLVKFRLERGGMQKEESLSLLDLNTGKITDTYHVPPNARGFCACATRENEFLFLGTSKDNHLEVIKYVAR